MNTLRPLSLIGFLLILLASISYAALSDSRELSLYGTRAIGMGGAYLSVAEGPESVFMNPANIPSGTDTTITIEQGQAVLLPFYTFAVENPFKFQNIKAGAVISQAGDFDRTVINSETAIPEKIGSFGYTHNSFFISSTQPVLDGVNLAVWGNTTLETLSTQNAFSAGLHLSTYSAFEIYGLKSAWALSVKNILATPVTWSSGYKDTLPTIFSAGINTIWDDQFRVASDLIYTPGFGWAYHSGCEWWIYGRNHEKDTMTLRFGLKNGDLTLGAGMTMEAITLNYAFIQSKLSFLEPEHRLSFNWTFSEPAPPEEKPAPQSLFQEWEKKYRD